MQSETTVQLAGGLASIDNLLSNHVVSFSLANAAVATCLESGLVPASSGQKPGMSKFSEFNLRGSDFIAHGNTQAAYVTICTADHAVRDVHRV